MKTQILENTPQNLKLFWSSGYNFLDLILPLAVSAFGISFFWIVILQPYSSSALTCERLEPAYINCALQKSYALGLMREDYRLENLRSVEIVREERKSDDSSYVIYDVLLRAKRGTESFYRTRSGSNAGGIQQEIGAFIGDPRQASLHLKKSREYGFGAFIVVFFGVLFGPLGILSVYGYFFSSYAYTLHFDPATKKLRLQPRARLWKLRGWEIPFDHIGQIKFEEKIEKDDDDKESRTYSLSLEMKGKKSIWRIPPLWIWLWENVSESERGKVEEMGHLIAGITGIPYNLNEISPPPH